MMFILDCMERPDRTNDRPDRPFVTHDSLVFVNKLPPFPLALQNNSTDEFVTKFRSACSYGAFVAPVRFPIRMPRGTLFVVSLFPLHHHMQFCGNIYGCRIPSTSFFLWTLILLCLLVFPCHGGGDGSFELDLHLSEEETICLRETNDLISNSKTLKDAGMQYTMSQDAPKRQASNFEMTMSHPQEAIDAYQKVCRVERGFLLVVKTGRYDCVRNKQYIQVNVHNMAKCVAATENCVNFPQEKMMLQIMEKVGIDCGIRNGEYLENGSPYTNSGSPIWKGRDGIISTSNSGRSKIISIVACGVLILLLLPLISHVIKKPPNSKRRSSMHSGRETRTNNTKPIV